MKQQNIKIKYILYARKSSEQEDRQVLSIDSQKSELNNIIQKENLNIISPLEESFSAKAPGRKIFNEMIKQIEEGKANAIITWSPNRLSRNSVDTGYLIYLMDQDKLLEIKTPIQVFRNNPNDKFLLSLLCSQAKLENDNKGIDVKRGLKRKAEQGWYPTFTTLGYKANPLKEKGNKDIIKDPERYNLTRKMFDLMLTGNYTPPQILKIATDEWSLKNKKGGKISRSTIYRIFGDPFYYGTFEYPKDSGIWYTGKHDHMITEEEYDRIQVFLGKKGKRRPKEHYFAFTGLIRCAECGAMITAEEKTKKQKNGNTHKYIYYHCTKRKNPNCTQKSIEKKELEKQIKEELNKINIPPEFHNWAMKWFQKENQKESSDRNIILENIQRSYEACIRKIDIVIEMRAANQTTEEEFKEKITKLTKEKNRLKERLDDTDDRTNKWIEKAEELFIFARDAKKEFESGDPEKQKQILTNLSSNLFLRDKKLTISIGEPLNSLKKVSTEVKAIHNRLEPPKKGQNKNKLENFYEKSSVLLRG